LNLKNIGHYYKNISLHLFIMAYTYPQFTPNGTQLAPVFSYPGGCQVNVQTLPSNTIYKWIDPLGGQHLTGPARFHEMRPDGKPGHGGIYSVSNGQAFVDYHGMHNSQQYNHNGYGWY
jgi:hypothetical protein